jgi:hypothetical protein
MKPGMPPPVITAPTPAVVHEPVAVEAPTVPQKAEIVPAAKKPEITIEKPVVAEVIVVTGTSRAPRAKRVSLPRRPAVLKDMPWATVQPPLPEPKAQVIAAAPTPPATAKVVTSKAETRIEPTAEVKKPPSTKPQPPAGRETPAESKAAPAAEAARTKPVVPRPSEASLPPAPQAKPPQPMRAPGDGPPPSRFGLGFGFGPSFGGAGGSLQMNLSRGLALHAGYGVYPTTVIYSETDWVKNEALWSAGLKIYPFPSSKQIAPYIDAQYGGFMVEAAQVITGIYDYSFVYNLEQKTLWGPSLLAGLEIRFGRFALSGGAGASYSLTDWDVLESRVFFAFEVGLGVRL